MAERGGSDGEATAGLGDGRGGPWWPPAELPVVAGYTYVAALQEPSCHDGVMQVSTASRACLVLAAFCAAGLTACTGPAPVSSPPSVSGSSAIASPPGPGPAISAGTTPGPTPGAIALPPTVPAIPADPGLQLEALMGQHSVLAGDMMRASIRGDADLAHAANAALGQNTTALSQVLRPFVDASARKQFEELWAEHILSLFDYAHAHATHDAAARAEAREESIEYEGELADYFVARSKGRLDRRAAVAAVHAHAAQLLANADAYAAGRFAPAARGYRQSYSHSQGFGETLARALMPSRVTASLSTPSVRLRSELTRLLGEHAALVMAMTRAAAGDAKDFTALGQALDDNTLDLTAAVDALFGKPQAMRFQTLWADQIDQLAAYNTASARRDTAGQQRARAALTAFQSDIAGFFSSVTRNRLTAAAVAQSFTAHDDRLLAEIDAYSTGSFAPAYVQSEKVHGALFALSAQVANGIGATVAARLPHGGSHTGGGGAAGAFEER